MLNDVSSEMRLEEIRLRRGAATPGEWWVSTIREPYAPTAYLVENVARFRNFINPINLGEDADTAEFIAKAPDDIDFLLEIIRLQKEQLDQLQEKQ